MLSLIMDMSSFSFYTALLRNTCTLLETALLELNNFAFFFEIIKWILKGWADHLIRAVWFILILETCHWFLSRFLNIRAFPALVGYCGYIGDIMCFLRWLTCCFHLISSLFNANWKRIRWGSQLFFRLIRCICCGSIFIICGIYFWFFSLFLQKIISSRRLPIEELISFVLFILKYVRLGLSSKCFNWGNFPRFFICWSNFHCCLLSKFLRRLLVNYQWRNNLWKLTLILWWLGWTKWLLRIYILFEFLDLFLWLMVPEMMWLLQRVWQGRLNYFGLFFIDFDGVNKWIWVIWYWLLWELFRLISCWFFPTLLLFKLRRRLQYFLVSNSP